jgi:hypothetical protein
MKIAYLYIEISKHICKWTKQTNIEGAMKIHNANAQTEFIFEILAKN